MKRKGEEDINDDFPLLPAIKMRRLDGNVPTMISDEEPLWIKQPIVDPLEMETPGEVMAELNHPIQENDERAIVLFKPLTTPQLCQSPSSFRVSIDPDFLSEIKYNRFMSSQSQFHMEKPEEKDDQVFEHNPNQCLAVVPWIPSTSSHHHHHLDKVEISELMMEEDEQMGEEEEEALMDVDEDNSMNGAGQTDMNENLQWQQQQQQQQQCMIQQSSSSSPLVWFR